MGNVKRTIAPAIAALCFDERHKMAFVSGPRQCGKTTLARMLIRTRGTGAYWNWDDPGFRRTWAKEPHATLPGPTGERVPLAVYDEIHKHRQWKRTLKGIYDTRDRPCDIMVTGSARLDTYRRGSDSLLGRYFPFRLHPFTIPELLGLTPPDPDEALESLFSRARRASAKAGRLVDDFMHYGPFPEPLLEQDEARARIWRRTRTDLIVREDLRDLTRIRELDRIQLLVAMLPERVGSRFTVQSLREDLETTHNTATRWLHELQALYYHYEVKPWTRSIPRSLRKEGKLFLWDFSEVEDEPARFENFVANHLLKACHAWTDTGAGTFELYYLSDKQKRELDFLVVRDRKPWLPVEVKISERTPSPHWKRFLALLNLTRGLQVVREPHWKIHVDGHATVLVSGAAEALSYMA